MLRTRVATPRGDEAWPGHAAFAQSGETAVADGQALWYLLRQCATARAGTDRDGRRRRPCRGRNGPRAALGCLVAG